MAAFAAPKRDRVISQGSNVSGSNKYSRQSAGGLYENGCSARGASPERDRTSSQWSHTSSDWSSGGRARRHSYLSPTASSGRRDCSRSGVDTDEVGLHDLSKITRTDLARGSTRMSVSRVSGSMSPFSDGLAERGGFPMELSCITRADLSRVSCISTASKGDVARGLLQAGDGDRIHDLSEISRADLRRGSTFMSTCSTAEPSSPRTPGRQRSESGQTPDLAELTRADLNKGGTYMSTRGSRSPSNSFSLQEGGEPMKDLSQLTRPNLSRGRTFSSSKTTDSPRPASLQATDTTRPVHDLRDIIRADLNHGSTMKSTPRRWSRSCSPSQKAEPSSHGRALAARPSRAERRRGVTWMSLVGAQPTDRDDNFNQGVSSLRTLTPPTPVPTDLEAPVAAFTADVKPAFASVRKTSRAIDDLLLLSRAVLEEARHHLVEETAAQAKLARRHLVLAEAC